MKTIFKNCVVTFKKAVTPGTEVATGLNSETGALNGVAPSQYYVGAGYYLNQSGPKYLEDYEDDPTWVSDEITLDGTYSKVRFKNTKTRAITAHRQVIFYNEGGSIISSGCIGGEECTAQQPIESYDVSIPSNAVKMRFGSNTSGSGSIVAAYTAVFVV